MLEKYGVGLFDSEAAAAATIQQSTYLDKGKTRAALVAPLSTFTETPQVVVFTADSEQVMWLLYAVNYERGGKMDLPQSGGALGGCADITAFPLLTGTQRHLPGPGLPHKIRTGPLPPHDGRPGKFSGHAPHPCPGHGQAHRHAQKGQIRSLRCLWGEGQGQNSPKTHGIGGGGLGEGKGATAP